MGDNRVKPKPALFWPREWPRPGWLGWIGVLCMVLLSALFIWFNIYLAVTIGPRTYPLTIAILILLFSTYFVFYQQNIMRRNGISSIAYRKLPAWSVRGTVFPYSIEVTWSMLTLLCFLPLWSVFYPLLIAVSISTFSAFLIPAIIINLCVLGYITWVLIDALSGRLRHGFVAMTSEGIYLRSWGMHSFAAWKDITGVRPITFPIGIRRFATVYINVLPSETSWIKRTSWTNKQYEMSAAPSMMIFGFNLAVNPVLLLRAINFYYLNETARLELDSPAGVTRIREIGQQIGLR